MAPRPARQHRGQPAARQVGRPFLAGSRRVKLRRVNPRGHQDRATELMDRFAERDALGRLVETVRAGQGRALVLRGDPGVGKTALLSHLDRQASAAGCRVAHAMGMQSEMELAFAGLHQLCAPMLSRAERLPGPQQDALRTALGLAAGPPPDRFLVGLAVLSLLSAEAGERPLICLVDDEQWLDRASAQALGFAARRLAADAVGLVFAAREPSAELAGLPELEVTGLRDEDARALLATALAGPPRRRARAAPHGPRHAGRDRHGHVRRARSAGAGRHRRAGAEAQRRDRHHPHRAGGLHRPARAGRADEPGDRHPAVPVRADGRMAPAQDLYQARHQFPAGAAYRAGAVRRGPPAGASRGMPRRRRRTRRDAGTGSRAPSRGRSSAARPGSGPRAGKSTGAGSSGRCRRSSRTPARR